MNYLEEKLVYFQNKLNKITNNELIDKNYNSSQEYRLKNAKQVLHILKYTDKQKKEIEDIKKDIEQMKNKKKIIFNIF